MSDGLFAFHGPAELLESVGLADAQAAPSLTAEVLIDGEPVQLDRPARPCAHSGTISVGEPVAAFIQNESGERVAAWELKLRARCGDCGVPFLISPQARLPRDGAPGVVLSLTPAPEEL